jgi:ABC-type Na+ efflux pump permease subunit
VINYALVDDTKPKIKTIGQLLALGKHYKRIEATGGRADLFSGRISLLLDEVAVPTKAWRPAGEGDTTRVEAMVPRGAVIDSKIVENLNAELKGSYKQALNQAFKDKGFGPAAVEINKVEQKNVNLQKKEVFSIGLALLFFSLFNVALGAAYPAIAATSEEFEHNTIEATLMLPVNRWFFLIAKLSAVVVLALLAGSLNLFSMYGDASLAVMGADTVKGVEAFKPDFKLTAWQIPWVALSYLLVSVIYSSILVMTAACCRTVRSSQQWISLPLTVFIILPFLAIVPQLELTYTTALIPVLGNILTLRSLFNGDHLSYLHAISSVEGMILVAVSMKIAAVLVYERFEGKWRY